MPNQPIADHCILIGNNITVTEPYTFAFGGFDGCPIYSTRMTSVEYAVLYALCHRAVEESTVQDVPSQMELPLMQNLDPSGNKDLIQRGYNALDEVKHCQDDMLPYMASNDKIMRNTPVNQWTEEQVLLAEKTSKYINQI